MTGFQKATLHTVANVAPLWDTRQLCCYVRYPNPTGFNAILNTLQQHEFVQVEDHVVPIFESIVGPLLHFDPSDEIPDDLPQSLSAFGKARLQSATRRTCRLVKATEKAYRLMGDRAKKHGGNPCSHAHDRHLASIAIWVGTAYPDLDWNYEPEPEGPNIKRPDAVLTDANGNAALLAECLGAYSRHRCMELLLHAQNVAKCPIAFF
jgi:hypothetical protein